MFNTQFSTCMLHARNNHDGRWLLWLRDLRRNGSALYRAQTVCTVEAVIIGAFFCRRASVTPILAFKVAQSYTYYCPWSRMSAAMFSATTDSVHSIWWSNHSDVELQEKHWMKMTTTYSVANEGHRSLCSFSRYEYYPLVFATTQFMEQILRTHKHAIPRIY